MTFFVFVCVKTTCRSQLWSSCESQDRTQVANVGSKCPKLKSHVTSPHFLSAQFH